MRIADRQILHLIKQWLKAPVKEDGKISGGKKNRISTPQGGLCKALHKPPCRSPRAPRYLPEPDSPHLVPRNRFPELDAEEGQSARGSRGWRERPVPGGKYALEPGFIAFGLSNRDEGRRHDPYLFPQESGAAHKNVEWPASEELGPIEMDRVDGSGRVRLAALRGERREVVCADEQTRRVSNPVQVEGFGHAPGETPEKRVSVRAIVETIAVGLCDCQVSSVKTLRYGFDRPYGKIGGELAVHRFEEEPGVYRSGQHDARHLSFSVNARVGPP